MDEAVSGGVWHACRIKVHQRTIRWCITKYESARSVDRIPVRCEECIGSMYSRACLGAMGGLFTVWGSIYEVACSHRRLIRRYKEYVGSEEGVYTEYIYYVTNLGMRRHALSNV